MTGGLEVPGLPDGFGWRHGARISWITARIGSLSAAFTTRVGGTSEPPYDSLNLGLLTGDDRDRVLENRSRVATELGLDAERIAIGRQAHGNELLVHDGSPEHSLAAAGEGLPVVDGHVLRQDGVAGLVFVADCLPIVMAGPGGVAVVHGGWRGLSSGIVARAAGCVGAETMVIGPAIGPCCYAVGEEVLSAFADRGELEAVAYGRMLDLVAVARTQAHAARIERVLACGLCTKCNPGLFFSHRGEGERTGRQAGIGWAGG
jgi:hypothetical protein